MHKLSMFAAVILSVAAEVAASVEYDVTLGDGETQVTETFEYNKRLAPSSEPYVLPPNVINLASKEAARLLKLQTANKTDNVDTAALPPMYSLWPNGYTFKDYVDSIWLYSISQLNEKEAALYTYIDDSIYGPTIELTEDQLSKGIGYNHSKRDENAPITIGKYASAALDTNIISNVSANNTKIRNLGIAIGAYAKSEGISDIKNQNIAIGPYAHAKGSSMIAIGPGMNDLEEDDQTGNNTYAGGAGNGGSAGISIGYSAKGYGTQFLSIGSGDSGTNKRPTIASNNYAVAVGPAAQALQANAVAIGHNSTANAEGAVQIGEGVNTTPNSLQFQNVKIIENGKLLGGMATPKELNISIEAIITNEMSVVLDPGSIVTILPVTNLNESSELYIEPTEGDLRNYEVYVPNEPEICTALPLNCYFDLPVGVKSVCANNKYTAHKLPVKFTVAQPYSRLVIGKLEEFDDGTDWSPIITDANVAFMNGSIVTDGTKLLVGTNLHSGVSLKIVYPLSSTTTCTNSVFGAGDFTDQGILPATFYNYIGSAEYNPKQDEPIYADSDGNTWAEFIYETKCGRTPAVFRKDFNIYP